MTTEKEVPMGLLDNLERGIEKAVRGAFSGRGGSLGPVEIATAVRRHMDRESFTMSQGRSFVPNVYRIRLSEEDFAAARKYGVALAEELCEEIIRHADSQGYTLLGPVKATFVKNTDLKRGQLGIESQTEKDAGQAPSSQAPAGQAAPAAPSAPSAPQAPAAPEARDIAPTVAQPAVPAQAPPAQAPVAMLDHEGRQHDLRADSTVIGRSTSADITIPDTGVSRRHLEVYRDGSRWIARDLGSTNGSYVDGEQLSGSHDQVELFDGALISLGNARLRFRLTTREV
ncbi:DUF3662 and FHA domain-containing protein [Nesterenkonia sp. CL21]|uniref:DUF3662 and FHA domain-containing protein n=1 Tax=unclassified Nesterenkonia TaxID=2629769 RepID=UPI002878C04F|nr:DUF3662 and FHA domain-containing protein [Nesterenkonia sp. CL21]MDS2174249.1 DUF3662 and FHA domain-containing protein [Nesterenkonia sp. CL21]